MSELTEILLAGMRELSLAQPDTDGFETYYRFLSETNEHVNLTAISGERDVAEKHFLDSLGLLLCANFQNAAVIDIGSGAGFPGVPLKLAEPSIKLTLLDSQRKRVDFMSELCSKLELSDVSCLHGRAEELSLQTQYRDSFDIAVSRAVAELPMLCELCLPFVRPGGVFLSMKSLSGAEEEMAAAENAVKLLGGHFEPCIDYPIPGTDIVRRTVVVKKLKPTPDRYPRKFAKIQKNPL